MKFKRIILIMLLFLVILTIGAVSAADNNATNDVVKIENDNEPIEIIDLDEKSSENATGNDEILGLDEKSNETALTSNDKNSILSLEDDDKLRDS